MNPTDVFWTLAIVLVIIGVVLFHRHHEVKRSVQLATYVGSILIGVIVAISTRTEFAGSLNLGLGVAAIGFVLMAADNLLRMIKAS